MHELDDLYNDTQSLLKGHKAATDDYWNTMHKIDDALYTKLTYIPWKVKKSYLHFGEGDSIEIIREFIFRYTGKRL